MDSLQETIRRLTSPVMEQFSMILRESRRLYLASNIFYYGLIVICLVLSSFFPEAQRSLFSSIQKSAKSGPLSVVMTAYGSGFLQAFAVTFFVNTMIGSFIQITLPSFIFPPWGILLSAYRAVMWGILFSPSEIFPATRFVATLPIMILEGQGYVLALFGTLKLIQALINPKAFGLEKRRDAYARAIGMNVRLYLLISVVLLIAAALEAFIVIYVIAS